MRARVGRLGGSGLWSVRPNFFKDVGFLDLNRLVGQNKKHDQLYWQKLQVASGGAGYIMGLLTKLGYHIGPMAGSVCNRLTRLCKDPKKKDKITFEGQEENIDGMTFDQFWKKIVNDVRFRGW